MDADEEAVKPVGMPSNHDPRRAKIHHAALSPSGPYIGV
jgi:hypothetical protein